MTFFPRKRLENDEKLSETSSDITTETSPETESSLSPEYVKNKHLTAGTKVGEVGPGSAQSSGVSSIVSSPGDFFTDTGMTDSYVSALESPDEKTLLYENETGDTEQDEMSKSLNLPSGTSRYLNVDDGDDLERAASMEDLPTRKLTASPTSKSAGNSPRSAATSGTTAQHYKTVDTNYFLQTSRRIGSKCVSSSGHSIGGRHRTASLSSGMETESDDVSLWQSKAGSDMDISKLEYECVDDLKKTYLQKISTASWQDSPGYEDRKHVKVTDLDKAASDLLASMTTPVKGLKKPSDYFDGRADNLFGGYSCESESNDDDDAGDDGGKSKGRRRIGHKFGGMLNQDKKRGRFGSEGSTVEPQHHHHGVHFTRPPSRAVSLDKVVYKPQPVPEKLDFTALDKFEGKLWYTLGFSIVC